MHPGNRARSARWRGERVVLGAAAVDVLCYLLNAAGRGGKDIVGVRSDEPDCADHDH